MIVDCDLNTDNIIYSYKAEAKNGCQLDVEIETHHAIRTKKFH